MAAASPRCRRNFFVIRNLKKSIFRALLKGNVSCKKLDKKITNRESVSYSVKLTSFYLCFMPWLVGNGQLFASFFPSGGNYATPAG
jgi:hypothetical protein